MAQNITLLGAFYPDVPSVVLPKTGGGTAEFYDGCSVSYSLTDGATANVTPDKVVTGKGLSLRLSVPAGYVLSGVSVTMGGVDITSQVFEYDEDSGGGGGSPTLQSKSVSYTPTTSVQSATVTADSGYDGLSSVAVSVGAIPSEYVIPSGTLSITENGTKDVTNYASVSVNVPSSGSTKNVQYYMGVDNVKSTSYVATDVALTVSKSGTYTVSWLGWRASAGGTNGSQMYINDSAYGTANTSFIGTSGQNNTLTGVSLSAGDNIVIRARSRNTTYDMYVGNLIIEEQ